MSNNVENVVPQILQTIQRDIGELRVAMDARFDRVDEVLRKHRRDISGLLVMAKSLSGNFAEELAAIEERVTAQEGREASR